MFASGLDELGYAYRYKEDPGRGHWYNIDSLDVACVDDPDLIDFFDGKVRDAFPQDIAFKTVNPAHSRRAYWLEVTAQTRPYRESVIEAHIASDTVRITPHNIEGLAVTLSRELVPSGRAIVEIEDKHWSLAFSGPETFHFSRRAGEFRRGQNPGGRLTKTPGRYGPMKQAMFSPFVLVYGTQGEAAVTDLLLHLARLEAYQWWRLGNGHVEVMPDWAVTPEIRMGNNLVLFGGPKENLITQRLGRSLPVRTSREGVNIDGWEIRGSGLAVKCVYPDPLSPDRLVVVNQASDREGLALLSLMRGVYAGAGLPDFVVYDDEVRSRGWGGVKAAGFFDSGWRVDSELFYHRGD
jgi:hypothetical protein